MQHLFDAMAANGWDGLEVNTDHMAADMQRLTAEAVSEAAPVAALFGTPEGHKVLMWLMAKTILRPPSDEETAATSVEAFAILKARRDGQNGLIFMILHALQVGQQHKPETTT